MLKQKYTVQSYLSEQLRLFRSENGLSQEKMSEYLHIVPRSYFDLEHEKYGLSLKTFVCFILLLSDDRLLNLRDNLRGIIEKEEE
ncbi:MAG: helix-turn-helix transcriptional regulator [Clostridia bacterium]|nr:helix-turn-helix transcriptional regulator [Clostridia bacterium]